MAKNKKKPAKDNAKNKIRNKITAKKSQKKKPKLPRPSKTAKKSLSSKGKTVSKKLIKAKEKSAAKSRKSPIKAVKSAKKRRLQKAKKNISSTTKKTTKKKVQSKFNKSKKVTPVKPKTKKTLAKPELKINKQTATKAEKAEKKKSPLPEEVYSTAKNDTMKVYMQEIGQISLVTKEQEVELAAKIHGKDPVARERARTELIKANLRLVVKIAHDFKGLGLPLLDLISEGNIGLMRAVEKFDPAKGAKFSSYAAWWIKQSMRRALANQSKTIRIPVQSAGKINKIKNAKLKLMEKLNREPSDAEIAEFLEFSERTVSGLKLADLKTFSLHDPIQQGEDGEFQDIIPDRSATMPDRILGDQESIARLNSLLTNLDDREKRILKMRFGLDGNRPKTLEEVSQEIGRTRERVRQIQNQALAKLRTMLADETGVTFD